MSLMKLIKYEFYSFQTLDTHLSNILCVKVGSPPKPFCVLKNSDRLKEHLCNRLSGNWTSCFFFSQNLIFVKRKTDKLRFRTWVFGWHFLKKKPRVTVPSRKTIGSICCQWYNLGFQTKTIIFKNTQGFPKSSMGKIMWFFLLMYHEHVNSWKIWITQSTNISKCQCMTLWNHTQVKYTFTVEGRPRNFNVTEYRKFTVSFWFLHCN